MIASWTSPTDRLQGRLLLIAAAFLLLYGAALTIAPAVQMHSWQTPLLWGHWIGMAVWLVVFAFSHWFTAQKLPGRDPYLLPIAGLLSGWGMLTIWRLFPGFGLRQTAWMVVGGVLIAFGSQHLPSDLSPLRRYKYLILTSGLLLTALTLILGTNPLGYGPRMWLGCCGFYLQPSEPLKLLLIVYLAAYLAGGKEQARLAFPIASRSLLPLLAPTLIMTGLALALLLVQRDLGTASVFLFLYAVIVYVASGRKRVLLFAGLGMLLAGIAGYLLFDLVRVRVDAWLNPWLDPSGRSYQIVQALLALANGGLIGRGPGLGSPRLVPVPHSDLIFTSISEESGLLGSIAILVLLGLLAVRGLTIALKAPDNFRRLLAVGLITYLVGQSVLIIGGNLRLLPLTGVTLPFVSYGGSSLVTSFVSLLLLLIISSEEKGKQAALPSSLPYLQIGGFLLLGVFAASLFAGWWAIWRAPALLDRTDNPRRAISDLYVQRGTIFDRANTPLDITVGEIGSLTRRYLYPPLSPVLGYSDPVYGQAGLEERLDPLLRGMVGNPTRSILWNRLVYGTPPQGVDVRLSLNLELQKAADQMLAERQGSAAVVLNAETGEILVMSSQPGYDANKLQEEWPDLVADPQSPLLNRAAQGLYPPGPALGPLLLAADSEKGELPAPPETQAIQVEGQTFQCAQPAYTPSWSITIARGCPGAAVALAKDLGTDGVLSLYRSLGLDRAPAVRIPVAAPAQVSAASAETAALGTEFNLSPLQMALAAATLTGDGLRPAPQLVTAQDSPLSGWLLVAPLGEKVQVFPTKAAATATQMLAVAGQPYWQSVSTAFNGPDQYVTWYVAGTLPGQEGTPLAVVVLLEENNPSQASEIGEALLNAGLKR